MARNYQSSGRRNGRNRGREGIRYQLSGRMLRCCLQNLRSEARGGSISTIAGWFLFSESLFSE